MMLPGAFQTIVRTLGLTQDTSRVVAGMRAAG